MKKTTISLILLLHAFSFLSGLQAQFTYNPDELEKSVFDYFYNYFDDENGRAYEIKGISVDEPSVTKKYGKFHFEANYYMVLDVARNIYVDSYDPETGGASGDFLREFKYYNKKPENLVGKLLNVEMARLLPLGYRLFVQGKANFVQREDGTYKMTGFSNSSLKIYKKTAFPLSEFAEWKTAMLTSQLQGQYAEPDIEEISFGVNYLKANYFPLFDEVVIENTVNVKEDDCITCRNDNLKKIENKWLESLNKCRRLLPSIPEDYTTAPNGDKLELFINDITYTFMGVSEKEGNKGYTCSIHFSLIKEGDYHKPFQEKVKNKYYGFSYTSYLGSYPTKKGAFESALKRLGVEFFKGIVALYPLQLTVQKIETGKRNRPEYLIAEKPGQLFNLKRIKFMIMPKNGLDVIENEMIFGGVIGKGIYNRKKFPTQLKVKIKKRKTREAIKKYIGKENELILITNPKQIK